MQNKQMDEEEKFQAQNLPSLFDKQKHYKFKVGEIPFDSDDTLKYFYFILSGKIKIAQYNPQNNKEQTTHLLTRGDMFDIISLLDQKEHYYMATVLEDSEIIEVSIEQIRSQVHTNPDFNRFFMPYLAKQMRQMEDLAVDLSLYDIYNRLLRVMVRNINQTKDGLELKLINNLSHEELASLVGSVRKVVNKNLQVLKDEGIIELSRKHIKLKSLQKLLNKLKF